MQGTANSGTTGRDWQRADGLRDAQGTVERGLAVPALGFLPRVAASPAVRFAPMPRDVLAQCPKCKTMETLQFIGSRLTRSRRFRQEEDRIYHDCGSDQPCRLHV